MKAFFLCFSFLAITSLFSHEELPLLSPYKILTLPINSKEVTSIEISECSEGYFDLKNANNPRIVSLEDFNPLYSAKHSENGKVRLGLYYKLIDLLSYLPSNVGIAFFEAYRPLWKQKEYFDKVFKELVGKFHDNDLEKAYRETSRLVSPFIDNIPVHCTGAAIDFILFIKDTDGKSHLLDLGKFGVIFGHNPEAKTLASNLTIEQKKNRQMLLEAASRAGLVNYGEEWWHYSYGDRAWAYVEKKPNAIYGLMEKADCTIPTKAEYLSKTTF